MSQDELKPQPPVVEGLPAILTAALGVVESAFSICSAAIERPLATIVSQYWQRAIRQYEASGAAMHRIELIDIENLTRSPIRGLICWLPPEAPMAPRLEQEDLQDAALEQFLSEHGAPTARISVEPIQVSLERPLWTLGGSSPVIEQLNLDLMERFSSIVTAVLEGAQTRKNPRVLVTRPRLAFTPDGDNPFMGKLSLDCRCCFVEKKPLPTLEQP